MKELPAHKLSALHLEWYRKLEATGFRDIEPWKTDGKTDFLTDHHIESKKRVIRGVETGKAELFRLAIQWIDLPVWRTRHERWGFAAWTMGWDFREITKRFNTTTPGALAGRVRTQIKHMLKFFRRENAAELAAMEQD